MEITTATATWADSENIQVRLRYRRTRTASKVPEADEEDAARFLAKHVLVSTPGLRRVSVHKPLEGVHPDVVVLLAEEERQDHDGEGMLCDVCSHKMGWRRGSEEVEAAVRCTDCCIVEALRTAAAKGDAAASEALARIWRR